MKPYDIVNLYIYPNEGKENEDLEIFVTEPGEEYYVHMYLWRINPFSFKLDAKVEAVDLTMKKFESHLWCNKEVQVIKKWKTGLPENQNYFPN